MKTCPVCGFHNTDREESCARCSALLRGSAHPESEQFIKRRARRKPRLWPAVGFDPRIIPGRLGLRLHQIRQRLKFAMPQDVPHRWAWKAGFLSLFPGGGQFYNYQPRKALLFIFIWVALAVAIGMTFFRLASNYFMCLMVLWMIYAFNDGVRTAIAINRQYWHLRNSLALYFAVVFLIGVSGIGAQFFLSLFVVKFRFVSEDVFEPTISLGDRVGVNVAAYHGFKPRVGDFVLYDPKQVELEVSGGLLSDVYVVNAWDGFERIVAGPNQTFEKRDGRYFLDGVEVPRAQGPMVEDEVVWNYRITAPEGHYVIIHTYNGWEMKPVVMSGQSHHMQPPKMHEATAVKKWDEACVIAENKIYGRVWFVYQPPYHRRFIGSGGS